MYHRDNIYGIYEERKLSEPCVLFQDYNGFWSIVSALYWSTSSRILVSRHPFSCIEEIISQYCPQCLSRYMDDEIRKFESRCPSCYECPSCSGILRNNSTEGTPMYLCSGCGWEYLSGTDSDDTSINTKDIFQSLLKSLKEVELGTSSRPMKKSDTDKRWKLADLEASLELKLSPSKFKGNTLKNIRSSPSEIKSSKELNCLLERISRPGLQQSFAKELLPLRIRLRSKRTLRCRKDVEEGKMSILVQPKLFPLGIKLYRLILLMLCYLSIHIHFTAFLDIILFSIIFYILLSCNFCSNACYYQLCFVNLEGDSSQKVQRGKWFVKDSSAIHEVPTILITKLPECHAIQKKEKSYLHLKITNPKDFKMKITIKSDISTGSRVYRSSGSSSDNLEESPSANRGRYAPFSLQTKRLQLSAPEIISFTVGAFEDELLRDDDDGGDGDLGISTNNSTELKELTEKGYSCVVSHNVAHLVIGLMIFPMREEDAISSSSIGLKGSLPIHEKGYNSCFVPLTITTEYGQDLLGNSFQSIIAFPSNES
jgi:ribosomal protein L37AE/L43A